MPPGVKEREMGYERKKFRLFILKIVLHSPGNIAIIGWGWEAIYSGEVENIIIMSLIMMIPSERAILSNLLTYYQPTLAKSLRRWFCQYLLFLYYVDFLVNCFVPALNLYQWLKLRVV